jgi:hypothetical protein
MIINLEKDQLFLFLKKIRQVFFLNILLTREIDAKVLHASNGNEAIELFKKNSDINLILISFGVSSPQLAA